MRTFKFRSNAKLFLSGYSIILLLALYESSLCFINSPTLSIYQIFLIVAILMNLLILTVVFNVHPFDLEVYWPFGLMSFARSNCLPLT